MHPVVKAQNPRSPPATVLAGFQKWGASERLQLNVQIDIHPNKKKR
jgi:hypothetical protein